MVAVIFIFKFGGKLINAFRLNIPRRTAQNNWTCFTFKKSLTTTTITMTTRIVTTTAYYLVVGSFVVVLF